MRLATLLLLLFGLCCSTPVLAQSNQPCPEEFFGAPLHPQMRLCQRFDGQLPASLTFHVPETQQSMREHYAQALGQGFRIRRQVNRVVFDHPLKPMVVVLSKDGTGTQVDILVREDS